MYSYMKANDAYWNVLNDVWCKRGYIRSAPRGLPIRERLNYSFEVVIPSTRPIVTANDDRNKVIARYTAQEMDLYDSGTNRVEEFTKASKFWEKIANPDGTINSAYGHLIHESWLGSVYEAEDDTMDYPIRSPWEWAKMSLAADQDTRQAVMLFCQPRHLWKGNKDVVCTMHGQFVIRDNRLNLSIVMRSNDVVKGLCYDMPWFMSLIFRMQASLADMGVKVEIGSYHHFAHSMHAYESDEEVILQMLGEKS